MRSAYVIDSQTRTKHHLEENLVVGSNQGATQPIQALRTMESNATTADSGEEENYKEEEDLDQQ